MRKSPWVLLGVCLTGTLVAAGPVTWPPVPADWVARIRAAVPDRPPTSPARPRRLLCFYRCDGFQHDAIPYGNKLLELAAEKTGAFSVDFTQDYAVFTPEGLQPYDAIFFNNTTGLNPTPDQRKALLDFVRGGKGICGNHSATDNFNSWPEGRELMGGWFAGHPFSRITVKNEWPLSPLTTSFARADFKYSDEIYVQRPPYSRDRLRVLLSIDYANSPEVKRTVAGMAKKPREDDDYALAWIQRCGDGRSFYVEFGHVHECFSHPAIVPFYLAGLQYALGDLPADDTPSSQAAPPSELETKALAATDAPAKAAVEQQALAVIGAAGASLADKRAALAVLRVVGSEASVPALAGLLGHNELAASARFALVNLASPKVDEALRAALDQVSAAHKVAVACALGFRGDAAAVPALARLAGGEDLLAAAAVNALGRIGGGPVVPILRGLKPSPARDEALLRVAAEAPDVLRELYAQGATPGVRLAAYRRLVAVDAALAPDVRKLLADAQLRAATLAVLGECRPEVAREAAVALPELPAEVQAPLVKLLGAKGDRSLLPAILALTESANEPVAVAALEALGDLGGPDQVAPLLKLILAGGAKGRAAAGSLQRLVGRDTKVADAVTALAKEGDAAQRAAALEALQNRANRRELPWLLTAARDESTRVRLAALNLLDRMVREDDVPALAELLNATTGASERRRLVDIFNNLRYRSREQKAYVEAVRKALPALPADVTPDGLQKALAALKAG